MNVRESFINFSRFTEVLKKNFCSFITIYFRLKFHEIMHKKPVIFTRILESVLNISQKLLEKLQLMENSSFSSIYVFTDTYID